MSNNKNGHKTPRTVKVFLAVVFAVFFALPVSVLMAIVAVSVFQGLFG